MSSKLPDLRILVDTSVWVDFLNGYPSPEQTTLAVLLAQDHDLCTCGVVIAEVFQRLRRDQGREQLAQSFRELTHLDPSTIDCLIAALAEESGAAVLARDRDMRVILESGLVSATLWPIAG